MKNIFIVSVIFITSSLFFIPYAHAQDAITLSITPPLIKNNVNPGQIWKSYLKIVNNNKTEINLYAQVMDFESGAEDGTVKFITDLSRSEADNQHLLSRWIVVEPGPIKIAAQSSIELPFIIDVPGDVTPGGHYAAILVGTMPPEDQTKGTSIKVSSLLGSLILLNVQGDANEQGQIREFSSNKSVYEKPEAKFTVRFENTGNVHIQPQGEIRVYNWLNKDKGYMTLNHDTDFGNVLPGGIRKWQFDWKSDDSIFEMGRYRAVLIVGYGENERQTDTREIYFWVLNFKVIGIVAGTLLILFILISLMIRAYIRRAIRRTQEQVEMIAAEMGKNQKKVIVTPEGSQVVDLKRTVRTASNADSSPAKAYKKKFSIWTMFKRAAVGIIIIAFTVLGFVFYQDYKNTQVLPSDKDSAASDTLSTSTSQSDESQAVNDDAAKKLAAALAAASSTAAQTATRTEEKAPAAPKANTIKKESLKISVLNGSGISGLASGAAEVITQGGFKVQKTGNAASYDYVKTEIRYKEAAADYAQTIADMFNIAAQLKEDAAIDGDVVVILGSDYK